MFLLILLAVLLMTGCEMGLGPTIDLEPPSLTINSIVMPDGTEKAIDDEANEKLLIGPWILVTSGFTLTGEAWDNVNIEQILVEEVDANSQVTQSWTGANIGARAAEGTQGWSIVLDNIERGERTLRVTAYDRPKNIGPDTIKQLTLLVDIDPPFIESIKIERHGGLQVVDLLPRAKLMELELDKYDHVDYFQNEQFDIRAAITHDFSLSDVTLNLIDTAGNALFGSGLARVSGSLYAPVWHITAADIIKANPAYATGRHYFNVEITARAMAGHTGQNADTTNLLFSLCWYPEADYARIQLTGSEDMNLVEKGGILPVKVFDDDNVGQVFAGLIPAADWEDYEPGKSDNDKLAKLIASDKNNFAVLRDSLLTSPTRNTVIPVEVNDNQGEYRLVVLLRDSNQNTETPGVWSSAIYNVTVIEEGIPVITVISPSENSNPPLDNGKFTLTGTIMNLDEVRFLKIAWIPNGLGLDTQEQMTRGQAALETHGAGTYNHIRIWELPLIRKADLDVGGKTLREYAFSQTFDVFEDFEYNGTAENAPKFFILYTQSAGSMITDGIKAFKTFRLMAYTAPPVITIFSPGDFQTYGADQPIEFEIEVTSPFDADIASVELESLTTGAKITVTKNDDDDLWTATDSHHDVNDYGYLVTAKDLLGNTEQREVYVRVDALPEITEVTSPHNNNTVFSSRDEITVYVVFQRAVGVNTVNNTRIPTVELAGITTNDGLPRHARYVGGSDSTTLSFVYDIQSGDTTNSGVVSATKIHLNNAQISGDFINAENGVVTLAGHPKAQNKLADKGLQVDGVPPRITGISFVNATAGLENPPWHKAGNELQIRVAVSRPVRVLGNPKLALPFNSRQASFQTTDNGNQTLVFSYTVQTGDLHTTAVRCSGEYISSTDLQMITDTVGANGNFLVLASLPTNAQSGTATIDAVAPGQLTVTGTAPPFQIQTAGLEPTASRHLVEYTTDGVTWIEINNWTNTNNPYTITAPTAVGSYSIQARQTDIARNVSPSSTPISYTVRPSSDLTSLTCLNPNGAYTFYKGDTLTFQLNFSGQVYTEGAVTMTIAGGTNGNTGNQTVTFNTITQANAVFSLTAAWNVPENIILDPLRVTAINIANVRSASNGLAISTSPYVQDAMNAFNTERGTSSGNAPYLKVISQRPTITASLAMSNGVLEPTSNLTLTFSHAVWPENGMITVKPYDNWHIPPVLSNDDFNIVINALAGTTNANATWDTARLNNAYQRTTHGLTPSGSNYVPDTSTKYVLDFNTGISGTGTVVAALRTAFNNAKYQWKEIESVSTDQVTGAGGVAIGAAGSATIEVRLGDIPNGRQWKVEIAQGAFRDEAGNTFAGWATDSDYWFWSQTVATPVIRVNRVSNNRSDTNPTTQTDNTSRTFNFSDNNTSVTTTLGGNSENISRTNVQYRIDCETPGAAITYGTSQDLGWAEKLATVDSTTTQGNFRPNSNTNSPANSGNTDATTTQLNTTLTATAEYPPQATPSGILTIGDTAINTARKDYIVAEATRTANNMSPSARGREGAFKTVIVYRNVDQQGNRWVKYEGTNVHNGPTTIDGFPMSNNDMSGKSSKYAFRNGNQGNTADWVWISWEVVSDFWHVGLATDGNTPNTTLQNSSWVFNNDHQTHSFRKYGNWGLRIGN